MTIRDKMLMYIEKAQGIAQGLDIEGNITKVNKLYSYIKVRNSLSDMSFNKSYID